MIDSFLKGGGKRIGPTINSNTVGHNKNLNQRFFHDDPQFCNKFLESKDQNSPNISKMMDLNSFILIIIGL
jgi:hypothetical protein